jgi:hypothetical protein
MKEKIEWYQEILQIDPGSKVFFPLARLLSQSDQAGQAVEVLRAGLACHPEHAEARLLLVRLLRQAGDKAACAQEFEGLSNMFSAYPEFWQTWSEHAPNAEVALALLFLAATLRRPGLSLQDILHDGLKHQGAAPACETDAPLAAAPAPEPARTGGREARGNAGKGKPSSLRTKTMAEVLVSQGDREGGLAIYRELLAEAAGTGAEKRLRERIAELTRDIGPEKPGEKPEEKPGEKPPEKSGDVPGPESDGSKRAAKTPPAVATDSGGDAPEMKKTGARAGETADGADGQPDSGREKMRAMMESLAHRLEERAQA